MVLPKIKEVMNVLNFTKKSFTKGGFRHITSYISGLIALNKKTARKIAQATRKKNHSAINRIMEDAKFEKEQLEERYLQKIRYLFKNSKVYLIIDDTLNKREGKCVEEAQEHYDHTTSSFVRGHQFFTSLLYTPFLQLPLFPKLYSKNTDSKIEIAHKLLEGLEISAIKLDTILFDSWYAEKELIEKCTKMGARVVCSIKTNRRIRFKGSNYWHSLSFVSKRILSQKLTTCSINSKEYLVFNSIIKLNHLPFVRMVISCDHSEEKKDYDRIHLISTSLSDTPEEILNAYKNRWNIETFHRDIKQNLGFAKAFFWKKEGIVRHSILVSIAYAVLKLIMYRKGISMTIGEMCEHLRDKSTKNLVREIVEIESKPKRMSKFEEAFI